MGADRSHGLSNSPCGVHQAQCRPEGGTHHCTPSLHFLTRSKVGSEDQTGFEGKRCSTGPQSNTQCSQADSHSLLWVPSTCDPLLLPVPPPQTSALQPGGSLRARTHLLHPVYIVPRLCRLRAGAHLPCVVCKHLLGRELHTQLLRTPVVSHNRPRCYPLTEPEAHTVQNSEPLSLSEEAST